MLLFESRQRVPPLRALAEWGAGGYLPFGWRSTRRGDGALIDGVYLRSPDSADATRRLVAAGATPVIDSGQWFRDHRKVITDPNERRRILAERATGVRLGRASAAALYAAAISATLILGVAQLPLVFLTGPALLAGVGLALRHRSMRGQH